MNEECFIHYFLLFLPWILLIYFISCTLFWVVPAPSTKYSFSSFVIVLNGFSFLSTVCWWQISFLPTLFFQSWNASFFNYSKVIVSGCLRLLSCHVSLFSLCVSVFSLSSLSFSLAVYNLYIYLSIYLSVCLSVSLSFSPLFMFSVCLSVCLFLLYYVPPLSCLCSIYLFSSFASAFSSNLYLSYNSLSILQSVFICRSLLLLHPLPFSFCILYLFSLLLFCLYLLLPSSMKFSHPFFIVNWYWTSLKWNSPICSIIDSRAWSGELTISDSSAYIALVWQNIFYLTWNMITMLPYRPAVVS